jgi:MFS transporter, DHA1 family, multidrug resistance protein
MLFNSVLKYLGDAYPDYAASVLAGNDFIRSSFGAGFPLFASASYYIYYVLVGKFAFGISVYFIHPYSICFILLWERIWKASKGACHDI